MKKVLYTIILLGMINSIYAIEKTTFKVTVVFNNANHPSNKLGTDPNTGNEIIGIRSGWVLEDDIDGEGNSLNTKELNIPFNPQDDEEAWFYIYGEVCGEYQNPTAYSIRWNDGSKGHCWSEAPDVNCEEYSAEVHWVSETLKNEYYDPDWGFMGIGDGFCTSELMMTSEMGFTHDTILSCYFLMENDIVVLSNNSADTTGYIDGWNSNHIAGQNGSVYTIGEQVTITAHPKDNTYEFVRWSNGATTPTLSFIAANDTIIYAEFRKKANMHTITFDPANGDEPTVVANVEDGATPTAPEDPAKEPDERYTYLFDEWYMGETRGIQPATCDTTYTAHYTGIANMYSLTLNAAAGQGTIVFVSSKDEEPEAELVTIAPEPLEFRYNTAVTLRAEAAEGYEFLAWQDDAEAAAERTVTILDDTELTATFQVKQPTGIEEVVEGKASNRKLIIDGQLIIQHDGKTFNAQGAEMR